VRPLQIPDVSSSLLGAGESVVSFSARLHKSANMLAAELFGTQLRMIRGVSAGLALSVIERYPCARALCEAYERCASVEEEEALLQDLSRGLHQSDGHRIAALLHNRCTGAADHLELSSHLCFCVSALPFFLCSGEVWARHSVSRFAPSSAARISIEESAMQRAISSATARPLPRSLSSRFSLLKHSKHEVFFES